MKKRIVSLFLAILMVFTLLPITAFALRTKVEITEQSKDVTVHKGTKLTLSVTSAAELGEGEYLYYLWFDPDMVPVEEIIDVFLSVEKNGVIKTSSIVYNLVKVGKLVSIYNDHTSMFDGSFDAMMEPNLSTHSTNITANETRRYQCLVYVNNIADIQELADALNAVDRSNLVASVSSLSPIMDSEIYGYALTEPITVTVTDDHEYDYTAVVTAPTCTEKGYTTYTCSCGVSYVDNYVDSLGHDFGEWTVTTEPSCSEKGVETRYCSRCDATETRDIAMTEHEYAAVVTAPTCIEKGYTTYTCSCGDSYVDDYVDALGHDYVNGECSRCHDTVIAITKQPTDLTAASGTTGKLSIAAAGDGLSYQWQFKKTESGAWTNSTATSAKKASFSVSARESINGYKYRCIVKDADGNSVISETAALTVTPNITKQPADVKAKSGTTGKFSVTAVGDGLSYQWQYQTKGGGEWINSTASSGKTATLSVSARSAIEGYKYRCIITNSCGNSVISSEAALSVTVAIKNQPAALKAASGTTGKISVTADGVGLTYQWQYQKTGSSAWTNSGAKSGKTANFSVSVREELNGYKYRCVIKDAKGNSITSSAAALSVTANITKQPTNIRAKSGTTGKISITAKGDGLKYQWQYLKPGGSWTNASASSAKTATLSVSARSAINGYKYRCKVTNSCGNTVTSSVVKLTVTPAITKQPTNLKAAGGTTGKFSVTADGVGLSYQWQFQKPGSSTWANNSAKSAKTATLSVSVRSAISGYKYRCIVKDSAGNSITSSAATLTVK